MKFSTTGFCVLRTLMEKMLDSASRKELSTDVKPPKMPARFW